MVKKSIKKKNSQLRKFKKSKKNKEDEILLRVIAKLIYIPLEEIKTIFDSISEVPEAVERKVKIKIADKSGEYRGKNSYSVCAKIDCDVKGRDNLHYCHNCYYSFCNDHGNDTCMTILCPIDSKVIHVKSYNDVC